MALLWAWPRALSSVPIKPVNFRSGDAEQRARPSGTRVPTATTNSETLAADCHCVRARVCVYACVCFFFAWIFFLGTFTCTSFPPGPGHVFPSAGLPAGVRSRESVSAAGWRLRERRRCHRESGELRGCPRAATRRVRTSVERAPVRSLHAVQQRRGGSSQPHGEILTRVH